MPNSAASRAVAACLSHAENRPRSLRYNREFALGAFLTAIVVAMAVLSAFSPYNPLDTFVVPPDVPPSWGYWFRTTSRGQDTFWILTL